MSRGKLFYKYRVIKNPENLKKFMACSMEKDCNACGYRDGCVKRAIRLGWRE